MILSNVQTLCAFPFEKVGIFLTENALPESDMSVSVNFRSSVWPAGSNLIKFSNPPVLVQGGLFPALTASTTLSSYYDTELVSSLVQPSNHADIPSDFPVFFSPSAIPNHYLAMSFAGGLSAISLFPSNFFPILSTGVVGGVNVLTVSAGVSPLTAFEGSYDKTDYYALMPLSGVLPLSNSYSLSSPNIFYSAHKDKFVWTTTGDKAIRALGTATKPLPIPAVSPYESNIITDSFTISFPLSSSLSEEENFYTMNVESFNSSNNLYNLSGFMINGVSPFTIRGDSYRNNAWLLKRSNIWKVYLQLDTTFAIPPGSPITLSYETSATSVIATERAANSTGSTRLNTNYHLISTNNLPYHYSFTFPITSSVIPTQDAFTVNFFPSAQIIYPPDDESFVSLSAYMVDSTQQLFLPIQNDGIMEVAFSEYDDDNTVFFEHAETGYQGILGHYGPAYGNIKIFNDGNANTYNLTMMVHSISSDAIYYSDPFKVILNKSKARINLTQENGSDYSVIVQGDSTPDLDTTESVQWSASPPENIRFFDYSNEERGDEILPNIDTYANALRVEVVNLGVEPTTISLYSSTYGAIGSTTWYPSSATYSNVSLVLSGALESHSSRPILDLKASVVKNNMQYNVPGDANITWNNNNHSHVEFNDFNRGLIAENAIYPGQFIYSNIKSILYRAQVAQNPKLQAFNINANVFSPYYNINANQIFSVPEFPSNAFVSAVLSASNGKVIDTSVTESLFFTDTNSITAIANVDSFSSYSDVKWTLPDGTITSGVSTIFDLNSSYCLGLTAFDAVPALGGFGAYDFSDDICLFVLSSAPPPLEFIAFPEYEFLPTRHLAISDNSYLASSGLKFLTTCGTQNFVISTFPGFDSYHYQIGTAILSSDSNAVSVPVTFANISSTSAIHISAFNAIFVQTDPVTIYNSVSSTGTNMFNGFVTPQNPTSLNPLLVLDDPLINVANLGNRTLNIKIDYSSSDYYASSTTFAYRLSTNQGIRTSPVISFIGDSYSADVVIDFDSNNFFGIKENSYNPMVLQLSGFVLKTPRDYNGCVEHQVLSANTVTLTAFDGPYPEIFIEKNQFNTNEAIKFHNVSSPLFNAFRFDDGAGHIQNTTTSTTLLTGYYSSEGTYSPVMTGYYLNGNTPYIRTWSDHILIKDQFADFDPSIVRIFPDELVLPYSQNDIRIAPDAWQHASTLNDSFAKIKTDMEFLSSMSYTYNANLPKKTIGWFGERNSNMRWRYDDAPTTPFMQNVFTDLKDISIAKDNTIALINANTVEIRHLDQTMSLVLSTSHITKGEEFKSPIRTGYNSTLNSFMVLDRGNKSVYIFDYATFNLTYYWGGVGPTYSHTHFNDPSDLFIDDSDNMYIVDSGDKVVKVYNNYLNWVGQITHTDFSDANLPISCTASSDYIFVLAGKKVYKFTKSFVFVESFDIIEGTKLYINNANPGMLYVLGVSIYTYTIDGNNINKKTYINPLVSMVFLGNDVYAINYFSLIHFVDYIDTFSVMTGDNRLWDWSNIWINEKEMVTDFVLNDSFKKIVDNVYILAENIQYKYSVELDENYDLLSHAISAILPEEQLIAAPTYYPIGTNEIVAYETINRNIDKIANDLDLLRSMLNVRRDFSTTDICWTWKKHRIATAQNTSRRINPYSWYELRSDNVAHNPQLSAVRWNNATSCQEEITIFPICYNWATVGCNCLFPIRWNQMECGGEYSTTWAHLSAHCCTQPAKLFDNCNIIC